MQTYNSFYKLSIDKNYVIVEILYYKNVNSKALVCKILQMILCLCSPYFTCTKITVLTKCPLTHFLKMKASSDYLAVEQESEKQKYSTSLLNLGGLQTLFIKVLMPYMKQNCLLGQNLNIYLKKMLHLKPGINLASGDVQIDNTKKAKKDIYRNLCGTKINLAEWASAKLHQVVLCLFTSVPSQQQIVF